MNAEKNCVPINIPMKYDRKQIIEVLLGENVSDPPSQHIPVLTCHTKSS